MADIWCGITYLGNVRAVAGLSAGIFCRECCAKIKAAGIHTTSFGKGIFLLLELLLAALLIAVMHFSSALGLDYRYDYAAALLVFLFVLIVCSELTGIKDKIKAVGIFRKMGEFSLYLFLNHRIVIYWLNAQNEQWSYRHYMFWYVIGTAITVSLCYILVKLIRFLFIRYGTSIYHLIFQ